MAVQAQLVTYPEGLQTGMPHNDDYTVRVRVPGGDWKDLFEYNVQVDMDRVQDASMVQFDMGSPVEVMVKKNNGMIHEVDIRPQARKVQYVQNKNVITFTLDKPQYLSVEFNGDRLHNLHLFANPMETSDVFRAGSASSQRSAEQSDKNTRQYDGLSGTGSCCESEVAAG